MSKAALFHTTLEKTREWVREFGAELDWSDEHESCRGLKSGLHAIRDRLTVEEAVQLAAQLPTLLRGIYYEGWRPSGKPEKKRHREELAAAVHRSFGTEDETICAEDILRGTIRLLERHVSQGEIDDIVGSLPKDLRRLWAS